MRTRAVSILLLAAATVVAGCSAGGAEEEEAEQPFVAGAEEIEGSDVSRITLVQSAVDRLALETTEIAEYGPELVIPYGALVYDEHGQAWTYTNPEPLVYIREPVEVDRIEGDDVVLASGPPAGTPVVWVAAAELYGVEVGVGGGH